MKNVLSNLLGEMPYLLVLVACYIIIDRVMFRNTLTKLFRDGWVAKIRRMRNRRSGIIPLQPVKAAKVLTTVAYDEGLAGHMRELSPKPQNKEDDKGIFTQDAVVPPEEYERVFADSRLEVVTSDDDDQEWVQPVPASELDMENTYNYPDDEDEQEEDEYNELETAFDMVVGREQTKTQRDLAERVIRNLEGTPMLAELEETKERIAQKIKAVVEETFADVYRSEHSVDGFMDKFA